MKEWLKRENPICIKSDSAVKLSKGLFYFTFALYLIFTMATDTSLRFESSSFLTVMRYGMWACFVLSLLNVLFLCGYSIGQLLFILIFIALYIIVWYQSKGSEYTFLQGMMVVFSCYHVNWDQLLRFSFVSYVLLILTSALLESVGILPTIEVFRDGERRFSLGFSHPNALGGYCLCLIILWLLIRYKKLKIWDYIAWLAMAAFVWIVPNSKTSTFLILILIALTIISKLIGAKIFQNKIIRTLCNGVYILMAAGSLFVSSVYNSDNALFAKIDHTLFTNRLSWAHTFLQEYSITLFGQKLKTVGTVRAAMTGTEAHVLDNFYVHLLLSTGIISFIFIIGLFTFLTYSSIQKRDMDVLIVLLIMAICFVYENHGTNLSYNFVLFYFVYQFIGRKGPLNDQSISNSAGL